MLFAACMSQLLARTGEIRHSSTCRLSGVNRKWSTRGQTTQMTYLRILVAWCALVVSRYRRRMIFERVGQRPHQEQHDRQMQQ
jgi:hypothetical protein